MGSEYPSQQTENNLHQTPAERRKIVVTIRESVLKSAHKSRLALTILAFPFLCISLFMLILNIINHSAIIIILGFFLGISLAAICAWVYSAYRIMSFSSIMSDNFSDQAAIEYLREVEEKNVGVRNILRKTAGLLLIFDFITIVILMIFLNSLEFVIIVCSAFLGFYCLYVLIASHSLLRKRERANSGSPEKTGAGT